YHAERAGADRVVRIYLTIGALSGIVDDSVQFYFDFVARDTIAEGAELVFERVPAQFRCQACGAIYEPRSEDWSCPMCGEMQPQVIGGRAFRVDSIEVA
ncbi:MAG: hydrogenase maturation nickel metallochaperone HypA, partial [Anaerolineae bacterium]